MLMPRAVVPMLALLLAGASPAALPQSGTSESDAATASPDPKAGDQAASPYTGRKAYRVEVITFRYLGPDSSGGETFDRLVVEDYLPDDPFDVEEYNRLNEAVSYTDTGVLAGALERLRASERYQVMSATAWVQPLLGDDEAVDVPLGGEGRTGGSSLQASSNDPVSPQLSGSLRVYGDYLLFVDVNLRITLPARRGNASSTTVIDGTSTSAPLEGDGFETFHLSERRRIKLEEIHYFDHPYFGAIVSVVRHEGGESGQGS